MASSSSPPAISNPPNGATTTTATTNITTIIPQEVPPPLPSSSNVLHRSTHTLPSTVTAASGSLITLSNGRQILDASCGAAVSCLGHGHARIVQAMARQTAIVSYCHSLFFSTAVAEELAAELCAGTGGEMTKAFIVSSGSEAMEAAMKLARQYFLELDPPQPNRIRFIARKESYHGTTLGSLSMGGHLARRALFEPMLLRNISRVSFCNAYRGMRDGEPVEAYVDRLAQELDDEFRRVGPENVCAFVAEPVVGAALGCVPAVPGYFQAMKRVCDKYGALLIFDEVMSGMGRCGTLHAWQQEGVVPDIQTIGKGLGGGYAPIAGLLIKKRVVDALDRGTGAFSHGQTYQGHPIACAAALEVQREIREKNLVGNVCEMGELLGQLLFKRLLNHPYVGNIRGKGLFWGVEFVKDKSSKMPFDPKDGVAMGIHEKGIEDYDISIYPGTGTADGKSGDHILLAPAYNVVKSDIEDIVDRTARVIEDFFANHNTEA